MLFFHPPPSTLYPSAARPSAVGTLAQRAPLRPISLHDPQIVHPLHPPPYLLAKLRFALAQHAPLRPISLHDPQIVLSSTLVRSLDRTLAQCIRTTPYFLVPYLAPYNYYYYNT